MKHNPFLFKIILIVLLFGIIIFSSISIITIHTKDTFSYTQISETSHLKILANSLTNELKSIERDLNIIVADNTLKTYLKNKSKENYKKLINEIINLTSSKDIYLKVRLIDNNGNEIVRINYNQNKPFIVPKDKLQNKKNRYYFKKAICLDRNQIYISPFDLNVEHSKIEKPNISTIRFCKPVFNDNGKIEGIVVLNYLGNNFVDEILLKKHSDMLGNISLINNDGYFIKSEGNKAEEFGFMFQNKVGDTFEKHYPNEWKTVKANEKGKILTNNGWFTFITISPTNLYDANVPKWKLISHIPKEKLYAKINQFIKSVIWIDVLLFAIIFVFTFFYFRSEKKSYVQQKEIEEKKKRYESIFFNSGVGIVQITLSGKFKTVNPLFCLITGYTAEELVKMKNSDLIYPDDVEKINNDLQMLISGKIDSITEEKRIVKKDGSIIWVNLSINNEYDSVNNLVGFVGMISDISEIKLARKRIEQSELKFRTIVDKAGDALFITNLEGKIIEVNEAASKIYGYTRHEMIGQTLELLNKQFDRNFFKKNIIQNLRLNKSITLERIHYKKDGTRFHVEITTGLIKIENETVLIGYARDISERIKNEKALIESERKFRTAFLTSPDSININRLEDGVYVNINHGFTEIMGFSEKDVIGKSSLKLNIWVNESDRERLVLGLKKKGEVNNLEAKFRKKNGEIVTGLMSAKILEINGEPHILSITRDISEIKELQDNLTKSEEKFKLIFNNVKESIFLFEVFKEKIPEIYMANETACKIYGYSLDELIGKPVSFLDTKTSVKTILPNMKKIMKGEFLTFEGEHVKKDGTVFPVEISTHLVTISGKKFIIAVGRDITERVENEKALIESERKFKQLTELSPFGIIVHENGRLKYANRAAKVILEADITENFEGVNIFDFVHPDYREDAKKRTEKVIRHNVVQKTKEQKYITFKGNVIDVEATAIHLESGASGTVQVIFNDITERKRLEAAVEEYQNNLEKKVEERTKELSESENKYRVLAETSDAYIARMDHEGRLLYANKSLLVASGKSLDEVIGNNPIDFVNEGKNFDGTNRLKLLINRVLSSDVTQSLEMKAPWGSWIEWHFTPEKRGTGKKENVVVIGYDITQKRKAHQKLQLALEKEKSVNELKTQFISTVSHEFRTPLTSIYSSIELLERYRKKWDENKVNSHFRNIKGSIEKLTEMLEDVLHLSRAERGIITLKVSEINLKELCNEIVHNLEPLFLKTHNFVFDYLLKKDTFNLDKKLLTPIIENLLTNAIKYSPNGGEIKLTVDKLNDNIKFVIRDEGLGIEKKQLKNIFNEFFRSYKVSNINGTGLGLSIVKRYVNIHNGTVHVKSQLGKGTEFTVLIPIT